MSRVFDWHESVLSERLAGVTPMVGTIYMRGEWHDDWWEKVVSIVGSRKMTSYGKRVIEKMVPVLVESGVTILSGMMYGVDQEVHEKCLECGGKTVAVLGYGIDYPLTGADKVLFNKIEQKGLIISEYADKTSPQKFTFLERNRIVAGISDGVVIIEGAMKSGSMVTAGLAAKMNKKLMAVPGAVTSSLSMGTNKLIKDGSAVMVCDGGDILDSLGWSSSVSNEAKNSSVLLGLLKRENLSVDEIAIKLGVPVRSVLQELGELELAEVVGESEGKFFVVD